MSDTISSTNLVRWGVVVVVAAVLSGCRAGDTAASSQSTGAVSAGSAIPGEVDPDDMPDLPTLAFESGFPVGLSRLVGIEGGQVVDADSFRSSAESGGLASAQVAALSDGQVDFAEYEQLFEDFVACSADKSIVLDQRGLLEDEVRGVDYYVYGIPEVDGEPADNEVAECVTRHVYAAEELYLLQHERPLAEQDEIMEDNFQTVYECYVDNGARFDFPVEDVMEHEQELLTLQDTYPDCPSPRW